MAPCPLQPRTVPGIAQMMEMDESLFRWRRLPAGSEIYRQDEVPEEAYIVTGGWVSLHRILGDGRRHIVEFAVPGDLIGFSFAPDRKSDHFAVALTDTVLCVADREGLKRHLEGNVALMEQVSEYLLAEQNLARQQLTNVTRNQALQRTANLLYQLFVRVRGRDAEPGDTLPLPLTQEQIGDAIGLTAVHVNRMLRQLRIDKVLTLKSGVLTVIDPAKFTELAHLDVDSVLGSRPRARPQAPRKAQAAN
jgi:CRP-like cAMP-binding protein